MRKQMTITEWKNMPTRKETVWNGLSPGGAAEELGVSRQMVHKAWKKGHMDRLDITDDAGKLLATIVPWESIYRYQEYQKTGNFETQGELIGGAS